MLKYAIDLYGKNNWTMVANKLQEIINLKVKRNGKQCRERYYNHLKANIKKAQWLPEEEKILFSMHMTLGNKWKEIAAFLPGRYNFINSI